MDEITECFMDSPELSGDEVEIVRSSNYSGKVHIYRPSKTSYALCRSKLGVTRRKNMAGPMKRKGRMSEVTCKKCKSAYEIDKERFYLALCAESDTSFVVNANNKGGKEEDV